VNVALIDYRAGNLTSVRKALTVAGADVYTPDAAADLRRADAVVVPGVGHFNATAALTDEWRAAIRDGVERGRPLLGICLGLQWLFDGSEEAPDLPGLGLLSGRCWLLPGGEGLKVPHVGWNTLTVRQDARVLDGVADGTFAYFTHSYVAPVTDACAASTTHGDTFAAVVERGRVMGLQFHPEKSGDAGLTMIGNFLTLAGR